MMEQVDGQKGEELERQFFLGLDVVEMIGAAECEGFGRFRVMLRAAMAFVAYGTWFKETNWQRVSRRTLSLCTYLAFAGSLFCSNSLFQGPG